MQDLKDYMRRAGDVVFSDVNSGTGEGVVEFSNRYVVALAVACSNSSSSSSGSDCDFKNNS